MTGLSDYYFDKGQIKGEKIGLEQGLEQGLKQGMVKSIEMLMDVGCSEEEAIKKVSMKFDVPEETVRKIVDDKIKLKR